MVESIIEESKGDDTVCGKLFLCFSLTRSPFWGLQASLLYSLPYRPIPQSFVFIVLPCCQAASVAAAPQMQAIQCISRYVADSQSFIHCPNLAVSYLTAHSFLMSHYPTGFWTLSSSEFIIFSFYNVPEETKRPLLKRPSLFVHNNAFIPSGFVVFGFTLHSCKSWFLFFLLA